MPKDTKDPQKADAISKHRAKLVKEITTAMKCDGIAWAAGWKECWSPINLTTNKHYRGINRLSLAAAMRKAGFKDPRWCTFNQIKKAGWQLKAGSHATGAIEFWSWYVRTDKLGSTKLITKERAEQLVKDKELPKEDLTGAFLAGKLHPVFNASQIIGVEVFEAYAQTGENSPTEHIADELIASSRCPLREAEVDEAFYRPTTDEIIVPLRGQFHSMDAFIRTILHEMCHSTARAVGREIGQGLTGYACEELSAELGSIFAAADAGLNISALASADMGSSYLENHAAYLKSWLAAIQDNPATLAKAAAEGSRAADYIGDRWHRYRSRQLSAVTYERSPKDLMNSKACSLITKIDEATHVSRCLEERTTGLRKPLER